MKSKLKNTRMYIVVKKRQNFVRISNVVKTNPAIDNDYLDYKQARMVFSHALRLIKSIQHFFAYIQQAIQTNIYRFTCVHQFPISELVLNSKT